MLTWLTNIPAPYRLPLWQALRDDGGLQLLTCAATEPNRDWDHERLIVEGGATVLGCRSWAINPDLVLYAPSRALLRELRAQDGPLVIDGWESPAYQLAMGLAHRRGRPVVVSYRGNSGSHRFEAGPVARVRSAFMHRADAILTGGASSTAAVRAMGVSMDRIIEGINAVDVHSFAERARGLRHSSEGEGHAFIAVGQLIARKNVTTLLDAFAQVRGPLDTLTIVGTGPEGTALEAQALALGLGEAVTWRGHLEGDDLVSAYAAAQTLVLPSLTEVYGLVVAEALATGAHAVISATAGSAASTRHMRGVFVAEPTTEDLARAMVRSRAAWTGTITDPDIITQTPHAAAERVHEAVDLATAVRARR